MDSIWMTAITQLRFHYKMGPGKVTTLNVFPNGFQIEQDIEPVSRGKILDKIAIYEANTNMSMAANSSSTPWTGDQRTYSVVCK